MQNPFGRFFGNGRRGASARKAELRGDLERAAQLFAEAGQPEEAARVLLLRGDADTDAKKRLLYYTLATSLAPEGHPIAALAARKRALFVVTLAGDGHGAPTSPAARHDLLEAARTLEALGDQESAADAYRRAGDVESEARALEHAGEVDKLEWLLTEQQTKDREVRQREGASHEQDLLVASGRRREALAKADGERERQLRARRALGPIAKIVLRGAGMSLVLGDDVVIGRTEGALQIASAAVSRRHLLITRSGVSGGANADAGPAREVVVRDLQSRNGTLLRGLALAGDARVGDGIDLRLGKEVPVRIAPAGELSGAMAIEVLGVRHLAPIGPLALHMPPGEWRLELASDGWIELVTSDGPAAFIGGSEVASRSTLLVGDAIALTRTGDAVLRVLG
jgi:tetratricopeptide (TPR) repeat protein